MKHRVMSAIINGVVLAKLNSINIAERRSMILKVTLEPSAHLQYFWIAHTFKSIEQKRTLTGRIVRVKELINEGSNTVEDGPS